MTDWAEEARIRGGIIALTKCMRRAIHREKIRATIDRQGSPKQSEYCSVIELESRAALSFLAELEPLTALAARSISRIATARCKSCLVQASDCFRTPGRKCCPDCTHESGWTTKPPSGHRKAVKKRSRKAAP